MSIFTRIRSMKSGEAKAHRDFELIKEFEAEHSRRHDEIGEYECGSISHKFYEELGNDVDHDDTWEYGAYIATGEKHKREAEAEIDPVARALEAFPGATVIPFMVQDGETQEQIRARIKQAFEDSVALAHLDEGFDVSGNDDEEKK